MKSDKIVPLDKIATTSNTLRRSGKKLVATNGCFDVLHVGHIRYLKAAKALGDVVVVGLNGDASVRELKGADRPINSANDRAEVVAALESVDLVTIFPEKRATTFIQMVHPDVYVKGGDYSIDTLDDEERALLEKIGARIEIVPLIKGYSTSRLLQEISRSKK